MPELIDLRRRIKSVRNTQQITQAMKTVSSAKFRKTQRLVLEARPFWHSFPDFLIHALRWAAQEGHPLLEQREEKKALIVVVSSDKGLCGAFNSNLLSRVNAFCEEKSRVCEIHLVLMGKKAVTFFRDKGFFVERVHSDQIHKLKEQELQDLAGFLVRQYALCKTDAVYVAYNEFKSILAPKVTLLKLLPLIVPEKRDEAAESGSETLPSDLSPDGEPSLTSLLYVMIPLYVEKQIFHFFHESFAAEHAARMMAMDNATQNAEDMIEDLTLVLNKIRQASITKELLEIMTAVEALAKK
jgi:F-type H+-transporting ATPase subunit gamma